MDVKLPKLGEGADSGVVVSILVKEGDQVTQGQTIIELENEKAVAPIPSPNQGVVKSLRVKEGDKLSVGQVILTLEAAEGAKSATAPAAPKKAAARKAAAPQAEPEEDFDEVPAGTEDVALDSDDEDAEARLAPAASPTIRKMARELGIDLRKIRGSERGGRVVMADLRGYIQRLIRVAAQARSAGRSPAPATAQSPAAPAPERIDFAKWGPVRKEAMTSLRKTISRRMVENWNVIPHVTQFDEADISHILELRKKYLAAYEAKGARLTVTSFAIKAVALTLKKHPLFNASIDEASNEVVFKDYCHIGLAVDTESGLIVPVIRDADKKDLVQLSIEINQVAEKARERKVSLEDLKGGTFTISNQGGIGGAHFTPIVNKPEVAILGLGKGSLKPVVREKKIEPRMMLPVAISYDHRLIDGGNAARFTVDLLAALEQFKEEHVKI